MCKWCRSVFLSTSQASQPAAGCHSNVCLVVIHHNLICFRCASHLQLRSCMCAAVTWPKCILCCRFEVFQPSCMHMLKSCSCSCCTHHTLEDLRVATRPLSPKRPSLHREVSPAIHLQPLLCIFAPSASTQISTSCMGRGPKL